MTDYLSGRKGRGCIVEIIICPILHRGLDTRNTPTRNFHRLFESVESPADTVPLWNRPTHACTITSNPGSRITGAAEEHKSVTPTCCLAFVILTSCPESCPDPFFQSAALESQINNTNHCPFRLQPLDTALPLTRYATIPTYRTELCAKDHNFSTMRPVAG